MTWSLSRSKSLPRLWLPEPMVWIRDGCVWTDALHRGRPTPRYRDLNLLRVEEPVKLRRLELGLRGHIAVGRAKRRRIRPWTRYDRRRDQRGGSEPIDSHVGGGLGNAGADKERR